MSDRERKLKALAKLGVRRQAQMGAADLAVYLEDVDALPVAVVELACETLGKAPRAEYETAYPPVGNLLRACQRAACDLERIRVEALIASSPLALQAPVDETPLTREEAKAAYDYFKARMNACMRRQS